MARGMMKELDEICNAYMENVKMEQKQKLEVANLLEEAAVAVKKERQNYISEPHAGGVEHRNQLFSLQTRLEDRAREMRQGVQKVMRFPVCGSSDKSLQEMDKAIAEQVQKVHSAIDCFRRAEFDVAEEFREVAAKAAEELASLIRRTR